MSMSKQSIERVAAELQRVGEAGGCGYGFLRDECLEAAASLRVLIAFVDDAANLVMDSEQDDSGHTFDMPNDDAVDTLHSLIGGARDLLGMPDRPDGEWPCKCAECSQGAAEAAGEDR